MKLIIWRETFAEGSPAWFWDLVEDPALHERGNIYTDNMLVWGAEDHWDDALRRGLSVYANRQR